MTLGDSLAHGLSRKNIREITDQIDANNEVWHEKMAVGKQSRGAKYKKAKQYLASQKTTIWFEETTDDRGRAKKAEARILYWSPIKNNKEQINIGLAVLPARDLKVKGQVIAILKVHTIARIFQTFHVETFSAAIEIIREGLKRMPTLIRCLNRNEISRDETYALLFDQGVILVVYKQQSRCLDIKTAISLDSMTPSKKEKMLKLLAEDAHVVVWNPTH